ncbi:septum formation initiator family protein [Sporolactobacillus sp. Y61]|jgi:cell division protein DivIC|uniref:Septum formation initiator family protein n=1 Tax=Sporolactobacillus sp. Y61 TaxID=3160863 RepID=A0AAU8IHM5_9BACL|nr:septum formation initiator family protein [Sporolactobacillus sp. THM19-2]RYL89833.1 DivIC [Sporolactobacillus sp. THM19-2]
MDQMVSQRVTRLRTEYVQTREIAEKRKKKRRRGLIRRLAAFAVVFTVICTVMAASLVAQGHQMDQALAHKAALEKQIDTSDKHISQLKKEITLLHDDDYIGQIARRDYLMSDQDKNEIIFSRPGQEEH